MTRTLIQIYEDRASRGLIRADDAQRAILPALEGLRLALQARSTPTGVVGRVMGRLSAHRRADPPAGLYLWGDVGRGKSMLMDLLLQNVAVPGKRRVHFHAYLLELHAAIHAAHRAGSRDPIASTLAQAGNGLTLLALDEMDVSDIADAMILDRVLRQLLAQGVCIVTTSNRPPGQLYRNGLKRELFLPFIGLLESRLQVVQLASPTDWRRGNQTGAQVFFAPTDSGFDDLWHRMVPVAAQPLVLDVIGRKIALAEAGNGVAKASFADLCIAPLGPADHGTIARSLRVLFLDGVPQLGAAAQDETRRFVTLIDELYEAGTGLVMRSAATPDLLFAPEIRSEGTHRLTSRLAQMQSENWTLRAGLPGHRSPAL